MNDAIEELSSTENENCYSPFRVLCSLPPINNMSIFHFGFSCTNNDVMPRSQEITDQEQPTSQERYEPKRKMTGPGFQ